MKKRKKLGRKLLSFLLTLAMVVGLMLGMGLTAYAAQETKTVTWNYATWDAITSGNTTNGIKFTGNKISGNLYDGSTTVFKAPAGYEFTEIEFPTTGTDIGNGESANGGTFSVVDFRFDSTQDGETVDGKKVTWTGKSDTVSFQKDTYAIEYITFTMVGEVVGVDSITINNSELTLTVGGTQTLTATVSPNNATDKKVKWSVGGTDTGAVKLYTDENCTTEVGANATDKLTVYAKGVSAGTATVTATSNADANKSASCAVTVTDPLADAKTSAKADLDTLQSGKNQNDYDEADWTTLTQAITDGKTAIDNATTTEAVTTAKNNAVDAVNAVKTKAQKALDNAKTTAKNDLDTLQSGKNQNDYDEADWTTLTQAITDGKTAIDNATTTEAVTTAKNNAVDAVNAVKTKAQKALDNAKTNAVNTVNAVNANDYIAADQQTVTDAKTTALAAIEAATTEEEVTTALNNFNNAIASCTTQVVADQIAQVMSEVSAKTGSDMTYTGSPIQLINTPTTALPAGYTMKYAVTTENVKPTDESLYTTTIPSKTDAGTYYVWYKVVGNENYNDSKPDVVTVTIKPSVTVTFDSNGGSEVDPQVIDKGGKAEEPEEPTNGKLAFIGWFIDPTIENLYDFDNEKISSFNFYSAIDEDTTLTAVWAAFARVNTIGTGKVNYAYEGEEKDDEYDDSIILSAIQGMADTFILTAKADEGSRFVKWQKVIEEGETVEDSTFEDYSEDEEITITITEPISLVAVFETIDEDDKVYSSYESDTEWTMGSGKSLKVGAKGSKDDEETINHFTGIKCNGKEIAKKYYTARKGSVIIEIDPEYLETLEAGKHVLTLMFDDADDLDIEFTVLAAEEDDSKDDTSKDAKIDVDTDTADTGKTTGSNTDSSAQTGDNTQILLALFIMIDSALALNYLMIKKRKSRKN